MENREPEKSNPNHRKVFYFLNILFMCMITAASLAMTVILFVRLERLRSEKQVEGSIYTDSQIESYYRNRYEREYGYDPLDPDEEYEDEEYEEEE